MRPEAQILVGLALIGAGSACVIAMNLWTVPLLHLSGSSRRPVPTVRAAAPPAVSPALRSSGTLRPSALVPAGAASASASAVASASAAPVSSQPASPSGSEPRPTSYAVADGTVFPGVHFDSGSATVSQDLMNGVGPVAKYVRDHFDSKVTIVGHGDAGASVQEYQRLGRQRAVSTMRALVDNGVSIKRIAIDVVPVEGGTVLSKGVSPGTVEIRVEPRFASQKGKGDVP